MRVTRGICRVMPNSPTTYYDDDELRDALTHVNSYRTLHEIYGLFYGIRAGSTQAKPKQYLSLIYDIEHRESVSAQAIETVYNNLLSLWNYVTRWKPEEEPFAFPDQDYPSTAQGFLEHTADDLSLILFFRKGLALSVVQEKQYSNKVRGALDEISEVEIHLKNYQEMYESIEPEAEIKNPRVSEKKFQELEDTIARSIANITAALKNPKK